MLSRRPAALLIAGTALLLTSTGCGPDQPAPPPGSAPQLQLPSAPSVPPVSAPAVMSGLDLLMGNYAGTLSRSVRNESTGKDEWISQPYALVIKKAQVDGLTFVGIELSSSGAAGTIGFSANLGVLRWYKSAVGAGNAELYVLVSDIFSASELGPSPIGVILQLGLKDGKFDPTQSVMSIRDCGFSQTVATSPPLSNVRFGDDLGKR